MNEPLLELRNKIDDIDTQLINLLKQRMDVVKEIGDVKKKLHIKALDSNRWQQSTITRRELAQKSNLNTDMIEEVWNIIHKWAISVEEQR